MTEVIGNYAIPTASQRKLNIRKFDGTELYKGLGSGFYDWGRTFMRAVTHDETSCDFSWMEDVKVGLLGHFLAGMRIVTITNRSTFGGCSSRDSSTSWSICT